MYVCMYVCMYVTWRLGKAANPSKSLSPHPAIQSTLKDPNEVPRSLTEYATLWKRLNCTRFGR